MSTEPSPTPDPAPAPPAPDRTFTQADVDRIVAERVARAKTEPPADYAQLQAAAKKLADIEAAQLTETERLTKALAEADAKATASDERARNALQRAAVVAAAQRAGAVDPDAVVALLDRSAVTVADDGTVTGADDAVKALLAEKLYLVGKPPTPTPGGADGGVRPQPPASDVDSMSMADYIAARKAGTIQ
jgi:hypothetical protein